MSAEPAIFGPVGASSFAPLPPPAGSGGSDPKAAAEQASAQQALAVADSNLEQDERNHSQSCVIIDQRLVDKAAEQLAQANAQIASLATTSVPAPSATTSAVASSTVASVAAVSPKPALPSASFLPIHAGQTSAALNLTA